MIKFREIISEDKEILIKLLSQLTQINDITDLQFKEFLTKKNINHKIYIIEDKDVIVGCGTILIEPKLIHSMKNVGHIEDIVIDTEMRGKGYGSKLIHFLINIAEKNNCYKVILDCYEKNTKFYKNCTFKKTGVCMGIYF